MYMFSRRVLGGEIRIREGIPFEGCTYPIRPAPLKGDARRPTLYAIRSTSSDKV